MGTTKPRSRGSSRSSRTIRRTWPATRGALANTGPGGKSASRSIPLPLATSPSPAPWPSGRWPSTGSGPSFRSRTVNRGTAPSCSAVPLRHDRPRADASRALGLVEHPSTDRDGYEGHDSPSPVLTKLGAAVARQVAGARPWTNVYGFARTVLAAGTLLTLLANSS